MRPEAAAVALAVGAPERPRMTALQRRRRALQAGFFALFLLAPAFDLFRFDLTETQLWVLGFRWSLGIDPFLRGEATAADAALALVLRGVLPPLALVGGFMAVAYRYGRVYCGWLCPHFSVVETLNELLHRATGKLSLWDRAPTEHADRAPDRRWWPLFVLACMAFGFLWAVTLLTYLLPPERVWGHLVCGTLTPGETRFLVVATIAFTGEFLFARHLFCRFGCAVGLFQSLAWVANPKALVVSFDRGRARDCRSCATERAPLGAACDSACPMRLNPRNIKRMMFSCVQCGKCLTECAASHVARRRAPNLTWRIGLDAVRETLRRPRPE